MFGLTALIQAITRLCNLIAERNQTMSQLDDVLTEISTNLDNISTQLAKGFNEVTAKIEELQAAAGEPVDPAVLDTLHNQVQALAGQAQALDDLVPDVPPQQPPA